LDDTEHNELNIINNRKKVNEDDNDEHENEYSTVNSEENSTFSKDYIAMKASSKTVFSKMLPKMKNKNSSQEKGVSFFNQLKIIEANINAVLNDTKKLKELHEKLHLIQIDDEEMISKEDVLNMIQSIILLTNQSLLQSEESVQQIRLENKQFKTFGVTIIHMKEVKIRKKLLKKLINKFDFAKLDFQLIENKFTKNIGDRLGELKIKFNAQNLTETKKTDEKQIGMLFIFFVLNIIIHFNYFNYFKQKNSHH
jgi:hypothetical protein